MNTQTKSTNPQVSCLSQLSLCYSHTQARNFSNMVYALAEDLRVIFFPLLKYLHGYYLCYSACKCTILTDFVFDTISIQFLYLVSLKKRSKVMHAPYIISKISIWSLDQHVMFIIIQFLQVRQHQQLAANSRQHVSVAKSENTGQLDNR